jgi:O-antigen/teichoic acid export membrane protein
MAFLAVWVATRVLGPAGYGGIVAILAVSQLVGQIAVHWSAASVVRYGCEEFVRTGGLPVAFWARVLILVPNLFIVVSLSRWWLPPLAAALRLPVGSSPLILAHLVSTAAWIHVQQALQAAKLPRTQGWLLAGERCQVLVALVLLAVSSKASPVAIIGSYVLGSMTMSIAGLWRLRGLVYPVQLPDHAYLQQMLRFSLPLLPASLIGYLSTNYLDAAFIAHFLSGAEVGRYAVAYQLAGTMMQLPLLLGSLLLPYFISLQGGARHDRTSEYLREVLPLLTLGWAAACTLVAALAVYLLPVILGSGFRDIGPVLWPLMAASVLAGPHLLGYVPISQARSATYVVAAAGIVSACANVGLNALLVPRFGLTGCAWATCLAYGASMAAAGHLVGRLVGSGASWTLQALLPAVLGAVYASWRADTLGALVVSFLAGSVLVSLRRRPILCGVRTVIAGGALEIAGGPFWRPLKQR